MPIITLTNRPGSYALAIAHLLANKLGLPVLTMDQLFDELLSDVLSPHERHMLKESPRFFLSEKSPGLNYRDWIRQKLYAYAQKHSAICFGFSSALLLGEHPDALHIDIWAPESLAATRYAKEKHCPQKEAEEVIQQAWRQYRRYVQIVYEQDAEDLRLYHLTINTDRCSVSSACEMIQRLYRDHLAIQELKKNPGEALGETFSADTCPLLKNPSEQRFAQILDMYQIEWIYEPKTFPLEHDENKHISNAFSPDFYLPRYQRYLELTVMDQRYVGPKNKKARLVAELYPHVDVRIVYRRDFERLLSRLEAADKSAEPISKKQPGLDPSAAQVLFSASAIESYIQELAQQIDAAYPSGLTLVVLLKSATFFAVDLLKALHIPCKLLYAQVDYNYRGPGETPFLQLRFEQDFESPLLKDPSAFLQGQDVLVLEGIVRSGFESHFVLQALEKYQAKSLALQALIWSKKDCLLPLSSRFAPLEIQSEEIWGYGMGAAQAYRAFPFIAQG